MCEFYFTPCEKYTHTCTCTSTSTCTWRYLLASKFQPCNQSMKQTATYRTINSCRRSVLLFSFQGRSITSSARFRRCRFTFPSSSSPTTATWASTEPSHSTRSASTSTTFTSERSPTAATTSCRVFSSCFGVFFQSASRGWRCVRALL